MKFLIIDVIDKRKKHDLHIQKITNEMEIKFPFIAVNVFQSFKKFQRFHCSQRGSISYFKHADKSFDFYLQHPIHSATCELKKIAKSTNKNVPYLICVCYSGHSPSAEMGLGRVYTRQGSRTHARLILMTPTKNKK